MVYTLSNFESSQDTIILWWTNTPELYIFRNNRIIEKRGKFYTFWVTANYEWRRLQQTLSWQLSCLWHSLRTWRRGVSWILPKVKLSMVSLNNSGPEMSVCLSASACSLRYHAWKSPTSKYSAKKKTHIAKYQPGAIIPQDYDRQMASGDILRVRSWRASAGSDRLIPKLRTSRKGQLNHSSTLGDIHCAKEKRDSHIYI